MPQEEIKQEEEVVEDTKQEAAPAAKEYTKAEQDAMALGWRPQEEFEGDADDFIPAKEFLRRGELFGRINTYKHEIQNLKKTVDALAKHNQKMFEDEHKKEVQQIKTAKKLAAREGDVEAVEALEEQQEELQKTFEKKKEEFTKEVAAPPATMHPSWEPWVESNKWYGVDPALRGYADGVAAEIIQDAKKQGVNIEFDKLLGEVSRKVKQKFPEKFPSGAERKRTVERDNGEARQKGAAESADLKAVE